MRGINVPGKKGSVGPFSSERSSGTEVLKVAASRDEETTKLFFPAGLSRVSLIRGEVADSIVFLLMLKLMLSIEVNDSLLLVSGFWILVVVVKAYG